jgi:putative PIN family toxin of toxin-antitoxin system
MLHIVIDTNVFVSGIISPNSPPAQLLRRWQARAFMLVSCQRAIDELNQVLQRPALLAKYPITPAKREALLSAILERVVLVQGDTVKGVVIDDPKDDMFVACAVEGQAKYIVSGDKHLRKLRHYQAVRILEPTYFLRVLARCQQRYG